jgi:hypothetical protein
MFRVMETETSFEDQFSLDDLRVEPLEPRLEFGTCGCTVCDVYIPQLGVVAGGECG